jgi:hypothetical protein
MRTKSFSQNAFLIPRILLALLLVSTALFMAFLSFAANPDSGSLAATTTTPLTWVGTGKGGQADPSGTASGEDTCIDGENCDVFTLTLTGTPTDWTGKKARVDLTWASSDNDYDVFIHKDTVTGAPVSSSAQGNTTAESAEIDPSKPGVGTGVFVVHVVYWAVPPVPMPIDQYSGKATVVEAIAPNPIIPPPLPPGTARMHVFPSPPGIGDDAGEPSIGSNWTTEKSFTNSLFTIPNGGTTTYYGGFDANMLRITFNDCSSPAKATWENKPLVLAATPRAVGDPILFTDNITGRTFVSQEESAAGSTTDVTDDDGDTFMPSQGAGGFSGFDHQTIASGPYHAPTPPTATYPATGGKRAVYYAAQNVADARMSRSDDGGITFLPSIPMYTTADCGGLHGHTKVTPDTPATRANGHVGTVYVPNGACGGTSQPGHEDGQQAVIVSEDNGITWAIRNIPNTDTLSNRDPSIGIATDGTIYFGMQSKDNHARIAVSHDKGVTWSAPYDVGAPLGIVNMAFPEVVAGDPNRAAFAFFGSTTPGANWNQADFPGVWYLYLSVTYDGGATWSTLNVTPNDPIQRGGICNGTFDTCRNLLDFFDATIDKEGRILVGYDDGCIGACVDGGANSFTSKAAIARQSGGKRMFAAFDPAEPVLPGAPAPTAVSDANGVTLSWQAPDNGGSDITGYRIYRGTASGSETFLATAGTKGVFVDTNVEPGTKYFYRVTAVNAVGEGPYCGEVEPVIVDPPNPCDLPGIPIQSDPAGDGLIPERDIRALSIAELFDAAVTANKLFFTLKVEDLTVLPPQSRWTVYFTRGDPGSNPATSTEWFVAMRTDDRTGPGSNLIPIFTYGHREPPTTPGTSGTLVTDGNVDFGTYDANGTIVIAIATPTKTNATGRDFPPLQTGEALGTVNAVTQQTTGVLLVNDDTTGPGTYTLVGNEACRPNAAPFAVLKANPASGPAPLTVTFDASETTDADDSIASYTFNFGDNSPEVTQSTPTVQHTYAADGDYQARLRVADARGKLNQNAARVVIEVGAPPPSPTPTPSGSPSATPSPTPSGSPSPATLLNISARLRVQSGDNALFGGFIVTGNGPRRLVLRGMGPSITSGGNPVPGRLNDPTLELHDASGALLTQNDNWKDSPARAEIQSTGFAPSDDRESVIVWVVNPGAYTAIVRGKNESGIGVVEIYDRSAGKGAELANISARGFVETGDNALIGGFIVSNEPLGTRVLLRAVGPSLKPGIPNALDDPTIQLVNANGAAMKFNDNWKDSPDRMEIEETGAAPKNDLESAVILTLPPAQYTAIVRGTNNTTGIGVVEIYNVKPK